MAQISLIYRELDYKIQLEKLFTHETSIKIFPPPLVKDNHNISNL